MASLRFAILIALLAFATGAAKPKPAPTLPSPPIALPGPSGWASAVDHPFFPLRPGTVLVYTTRAGKHTGVDTVAVLRETKTIMGIRATVVRDRTYESGALAEDSFDWYAQDSTGNVWYLGEDTRAYRAGKVVSTPGSWEAGKDGAKPGIMMWANPRPGPRYRQEFRRGVAEDQGRVLGVGARTAAADSLYDGCLLIEEWSPLEPGVKEHKFYARGVGLVRMQTTLGPLEAMVLVKAIAR
jgi:hypothetical protein